MDSQTYNLSFKIAQLGTPVQKYEDRQRCLQWIYVSLSSVIHDSAINGIQLYPAKWPRTAHISVNDLDTKNKLLVEGLEIEGRHIELHDEYGGPVVKVTIYDAPFSMDNEQIKELFSQFGDILRVEHEYLSVDGRITSCKNGNRIAYFCAISEEIPQIFAVHHQGCPITLNTWYRERNATRIQKQCYKCGASEHEAKACLYAEKICFLCKEPGHRSSQCEKNKQRQKVVSQRENETVICFMGEGSTFSNFCRKFPVTIDNVEYVCNEQFIVQQKALLFNDLETAARVMELQDPKQIYQLGKSVKNFEFGIWKEHRDAIVKKCNIQKYTDHPVARFELMNTGNKLIAEATSDLYWGVGMRITEPDIMDSEMWEGKNAMGEILQDIRSDFQVSEMIDNIPDDHAKDPKWLVIIGDSSCGDVQIDHVPFKVENVANRGAKVHDIEKRTLDITAPPVDVWAILLHVGISDFDEQRMNNVDVLYAELVEAVAGLTLRFPNAEILLSSVPPRKPNETNEKLNQEILSLNLKLCRLAKTEQNLMFIDNDRVFRANGDVNSGLFEESDHTGVQLNTNGLQVLTDKFKESAIEAYYKIKLEGEFGVVANRESTA